VSMPPCATCPRIPYRRPIPADGPRPCRIMLLGEAPHVDEDRQGIPFCGKTGMELNNVYLPILGLPRSEVLVFNSCACSQPDYSNPTPEQALVCSSVHLGPLLNEVRPEVVVPMGAVACSLFGEMNLNVDHGIPRESKWGGRKFVLWPMFHPSSGLHASAMMIPLMADFHALKKFLRLLDAA
jgi:uracil-DNA glycosylase family 4